MELVKACVLNPSAEKRAWAESIVDPDAPRPPPGREPSSANQRLHDLYGAIDHAIKWGMFR
jgi:hypothetical protein